MRSQINPETLTLAGEEANRLFVEVTINYDNPEDLLAWAEQIEKNFILPCRKRAKLLAEKYGQ